jgi:hypothetical protein
VVNALIHAARAVTDWLAGYAIIVIDWSPFSGFEPHCACGQGFKGIINGAFPPTRDLGLSRAEVLDKPRDTIVDKWNKVKNFYFSINLI